MFKLTGNPILYPHQVKILTLFFLSPFSKSFFLTGGTALSAFYLAHRESQDLDFFSIDKFDSMVLRTTMQEIAEQTGSKMTISQRSQTYNEIFLENRGENWRQKIDIIQEQPKHFGKLIKIEGVAVDSLVNIATNKVLAVFGRLEIKDYLDLYLICNKSDYKFPEIFELAKQKDSGLSEFYFASTILNVENFETYPFIKIPFDKSAFVKFYQDLSTELLLKIKPK